MQDQLGELLHGDHYDHWNHRLLPQLLHRQDQEPEDCQPGKIQGSSSSFYTFELHASKIFQINIDPLVVCGPSTSP